jgi:outer membrane protein TolC
MTMRPIASTLSSLFCCALLAQAPGTLTLEQARAAALANHPVSTDKQLYLQAGEERARVAGEQWLPHVNAAAQATYQSEVTEFDLSALGFPAITISPDQYHAGFEVQQTLYEFGSTHAKRELERTKAQAQATQADVDLLGISARVDRIYGNILLQRENLRILRSRAAEIAARQSKVASAVRNGMSLKSNEEVLNAEALTTQQRIVEAQAGLVELAHALSVLMAQPVDTTTAFVLPTPPAPNAAGRRPELQLFSLQQAGSDLQAALVRKSHLPRITAFGNGYYGRPGYNFLNNDFRTYGIVGVGLTWDITGLATQGKSLRVLDIEQQLIQGKQRAFELQQRIDLDQEELEIAKLEKLAELDEAIVRSKTAVREAAASQLENGVITAQDYVTYQNAQDQAKLDLELHRIQAVMARIDHQRTQGY